MKNFHRRRDLLLEPATIRTFLIRVAAKFTHGGRQQKMTAVDQLLYESQGDAWVDVGFA